MNSDAEAPARYTLQDFAPRIGGTFQLATGESLRLADASPLPDSGREGGSFRLGFVGAAASMLPQAIHAMEHDGRAFEIFIVPVGRTGDDAEYEAIFF